MRLRIRKLRDLLAGLFFATLGSVVAFACLNYPSVTAAPPGPEYLPLMLAATLVGFGLTVITHSVAVEDNDTSPLATLPAD